MCKYYCQVHFFLNRLYSKFKQFVVKSNPISFKGAVFFSMCNLSIQFQQNSPACYAMCFQFSFFQFCSLWWSTHFDQVLQNDQLLMFPRFYQKSGEATSGQRHPKTRLNFILDLKLYNQIILKTLKTKFKRLIWYGYLFRYVFSRNLIFL